MQLNEITVPVLVGIFSFLGAIAGNWFSARIAGQERKEARRKERFLHLVNLTTDLINLRSQLQWLQQRTALDNDFNRQQEAYGRAYAVMLSTYDPDIVKAADLVMHGKEWTDEKNEKIEAIDFGIKRLGELISQAMYEE